MKNHGTAVTFYRRPDGTLVGYRAEGHTGYAESGSDIVCAAVSALTQATLNGLKEVLGAPVMFDIDDRTASLEARLTPEATRDVIEKEVPGIPEAIRYESLKITPRAMLSRATAGIRGRTLIVNLPGSPKAVRESLAVVLPVLDHAIETMSGRTLSCGKD